MGVRSFSSWCVGAGSHSLLRSVPPPLTATAPEGVDLMATWMLPCKPGLHAPISLALPKASATALGPASTAAFARSQPRPANSYLDLCVADSAAPGTLSSGTVSDGFGRSASTATLDLVVKPTSGKAMPGTSAGQTSKLASSSSVAAYAVAANSHSIITNRNNGTVASNAIISDNCDFSHPPDLQLTRSTELTSDRQIRSGAQAYGLASAWPASSHSSLSASVSRSSLLLGGIATSSTSAATTVVPALRHPEEHLHPERVELSRTEDVRMEETSLLLEDDEAPLDTEDEEVCRLMANEPVQESSVVGSAAKYSTENITAASGKYGYELLMPPMGCRTSQEHRSAHEAQDAWLTVATLTEPSSQ
ncbi:unnamed protein product [Protopolystoma xenopodis]|uniref:Uncharacterized protein n=1 Tax=Protopolystoma xenopodis TaxID=117903 RepID=A0A3S5FFZ4_9PLAT|nr:unnamed protein product [Protopolystoma xenopodis]